VFAVTQAYQAYQESKSAPAAPARANMLSQNVEFHLLDLVVNDADADAPVALGQGETLRARARVHSRDGRVPVVMFGVARADGTPVYGVSSEMDGVRPRRESEHAYSIEIAFADLALLPGAYLLRAHPFDPEGVRLFDTLERNVTVSGQSREMGTVHLRHAWLGVEEVAPAQRIGVVS
jgi:lipopolysaccharide transport system ATP-binding protein